GDLDPIFDRLRSLADLKRRQNGDSSFVHPKANLGEAQTIVHAKRRRYYVLTNDRDALKVSGEEGVGVMTTVTFAKGMVGAGARVDVLARELLDIQARNIDLGGRMRGQLDLVPRRKPDGES
ncbi:hypothetical protein K7G98_28450, partial [Saccharothrix sp. MB29]|nr:hypothetical protein [Saccharothrix sp. MB29]